MNKKITKEFVNKMSKGVKIKNIQTKPCTIKKREGRKIIPSNTRAWNACLGNLLPETFKKNIR